MPEPVPHLLSPGAHALLRLLAFMAPAPFPLPALRASAASAGGLPPELGAIAGHPAALEAAEAELWQAGLLDQAGPAPVVRAEAAERVRLDLGAEASAWAAAAAHTVASAYPREPERADAAAQADVLLPHALRTARWCQGYGEGLLAAGHCLLGAGRTLLARGRPEAARAALEDAVRLLEQSSGAEHPSVAMALTYLNGALAAVGERAPLLDNARRVLAILEAAHGPRHREVVLHVNNVGTLLRGAGRLEESIPFFLRAMELSEEVFGTAHPFTATLHGNLGDVLHRLGRLEDARPHLARALATDEAAYGPAHPSVARDLHRLGRLLAELGERAEALALMQRAIDYLQPAAGEADPRVQHLRAGIRALGG